MKEILESLKGKWIHIILWETSLAPNQTETSRDWGTLSKWLAGVILDVKDDLVIFKETGEKRVNKNGTPQELVQVEIVSYIPFSSILTFCSPKVTRTPIEKPKDLPISQS